MTELFGPLDWLPVWTAVLTVLIAGVLVYWSMRFLPFTGWTSPSRLFTALALAVGVMVVGTGVLQLSHADEVTAWWWRWLSAVLVLIAVVSAIAFRRARPCYPAWVAWLIAALAVAALAVGASFWFLDAAWLVYLLLLILLLYLLWLGSVMLACTKPERCLEPCNCKGMNCEEEVPHVHCTVRVCQGAGCAGACTRPKGHEGSHRCTHDHAF